MKDYVKWAVIGLTIIVFIGGLALFATKLFGFNDSLGDIQDNPTPEQLVQIDKAFESDDGLTKDEVADQSAFYNTTHEMLNTKIIAGDGKVWGFKTITKKKVEGLQQAVKDLKITDTRITDMLDRWSKKDFSQAVEEHNFIWSEYLGGTVGKAVKLRY